MSVYDPVAASKKIIVRDTLTKVTAQKLATELDEYWHSRGHTNVQHWVERATISGESKCNRGATWVVRSNLIRGMPPRDV